MMQFPWMRTVALASVIALVAALAGCGGGGSSGAGNNARTLTSITVGPPSATIKVGATGPFAATGNYDNGTHQNLTSLVTWSSSDSNVATVNSSGVATGQSGGNANIVATMGAVNGSDALIVTPPVSITLSPNAAAVALGGSLNYTAAGKFSDGTTLDLTRFVSWSSSAGAASIDGNGVASGVSKGVTTISASNSAIVGITLLNVTDKNFSNASLNGHYAFTLTGFDMRGPAVESGSILMDGNGVITAGREDVNTAAGVSNATVTGTYLVYPDGRGIVVLTANGNTRTLRLVLKANSPATSDTSGELIEDDTQGNAIGTLEPQDASAFNNVALANSTFAFRVGGLATAAGHYTSRLGLFSTDGAGTSMTGRNDISDGGTMTSNPSILGTIGSVDATTGRAIATLDGANYVFYSVSANKLNIIDVDVPDALAGTAERQIDPSPATAGGYVLTIEIGGTRGTFWIMGQFDVSGTSVVDGVQSQDGGPELAIASGTLTVGSDGRGTLHELTNHGTRDFIVYVLSPEKMYVLQSSESHAASGIAELQHPGPGGAFSAASLNGDFKFSAAETGESNLTFLGQLVADGNGNVSGIEDLSRPLLITNVAVDGTYTVASSGQVIVTINSSGAGVPGLTLYLVSPSKGYYLGSPDPDVNGVLELQ